MVGDFFTKPLQGASFTKFKDLIMGNTTHDFNTASEPMTPITSMPRSVLNNDPNARNKVVNPGKEFLESVLSEINREEHADGWVLVSRKKNNKSKNVRFNSGIVSTGN